MKANGTEFEKVGPSDTQRQMDLRAADAGYWVPENIDPNGPGICLDCVREGTRTVHLRICLSCGNVGCCDSSVGRHASRHFDHTTHPVMRSFEPGESWRWCYFDERIG